MSTTTNALYVRRTLISLSQRTDLIRRFMASVSALAFLLAVCAPSPAWTQTYTVLHSFSMTDGLFPYAGLVEGTDGNLYGTTVAGECGGYVTNGSVFKISPGGVLTTLYSFGCSSTDGFDPFAGLVQGSDGNFYGTTSDGGANGNYGTVFKITPSGALTYLYSFCSQSGCTDGSHPYAGLVQGSDGNFYGTTASGGANGDYGTVFKITPSGTLTTLYSFCSQGNGNCADGSGPLGGLVQASDGNFYGTTEVSGANGGNYGTVFRITPGGAFTTLYSFCSPNVNCQDGYQPTAGLVQAADGNLYGTTAGGGANGNYGTVFKITLGGALTTLYSFCSESSCADGQEPFGALVQASDGNFYGTTENGGANGLGTVFKITPGGTLTRLYSFCSQNNCADGDVPLAGLVQATNGNFYGTTEYGGANGNYGTVFSLSLASAPAVSLSASSLSFGNQVMQTTSATQTVIVTNSGNSNLTFSAGAVTISGANAADFSITSDSCSGYTIGWTAPDNTCSVSVAFTPTFLPAGSETASMNFTDNASGGMQSVALSGTGTYVTPQATVQAIIDQVNALYSQGVLSKGQDNSLVKELQQAIKLMNAGKTGGAISSLEDFISEVNDLLNSGVLTSDQASSLINAANSVIAQLQTL